MTRTRFAIIPGASRLLVLALAIAAAPMQAKDFPVANAHDFDTALQAVAPGDAIVLRAGVWRDVTLHLRAQGEPGRPVTLRAAVPGTTLFEGSSRLVVDGAHLVVSGLKFQRNERLEAVVTPYRVTVASVVTFTQRSADCRLTETAIVDSGEGVTTYVHLEPGSRRNRVDHCFFSNQGAIGVTFYVEVHPTQPNRHVIERNYFGDRKPGTGNRWETMRIGHAEQQDFVSEATVAHNYFFRCNGENECISDKSTGNRYLHNAFVETRGQLTLRHGSRARVEGNYFFAGEDPASDGLRVIGPEHVVINNYFKGVRHGVIVYSGEPTPTATGYRPVERVLIAFNTIEACAFPLVLGASGRPVPPKDLTLAGNLVLSSSQPMVQLADPGAEIVYAGNLMLGPELGIGDRPGIGREAPPLITDRWGRKLPDPAGTSSRVERDAAASIERDIDSTPRPRETLVGAVETTDATPQYPLARLDVGPLWMGRRNERGPAID